MSISKAISGNLAAGSFGRVINSLAPILLVPLMVRTWGLVIYGEWILLTAIPAYIMLAPDFGLAGAVVNRMAYLTAEGKEQDAIYIYRSSFVVLIIAASAFVFTGWLVAWLVDWSVMGVNKLAPNSAILIIGCSCIQIFIAQQCFLLSGIYRSAGKNSRFILFQSISNLFYLGVGIFALIWVFPPYKYVVILTLAYVLFFLVLFSDSRKIMPKFTLSLEGVSLARIRPYVVPGLGHAGMPLINALQNQGVLLVLGYILGPASVALFQTARVFSNGVKSLVGLLGNAIVVELPALLGEGKTKAVEYLLVRNTQVGNLLALGSIVTVIFVGKLIYGVWLGEQVPYNSELVLLLFISLIPFVLGNSFMILLLANNQIHLALIPLLLVALVSIVCVGVGSHLAGLAGSATGVICWEIGMAVVVARVSSKNLLKLNSYFRECLNLKLLCTETVVLFKRALYFLKRNY